MTHPSVTDALAVLLVGGRSAVAHRLLPRLTTIAQVTTAGRGGCMLELDLSQPTARWELPARTDVLINLAADGARGGWAALDCANAVNAVGALRLCEAARAVGARHVVHISSIHASLPPSSPLFSAYSLTKRHGEELVQAACRHLGLSLTVLRPTRLYGPPDLFRHLQPAFFAILDKVADNVDVVIAGGHDPLRNFLHVDDLAEVIVQCVERRIDGTFDVVHPENATLASVARAGAQAFGSRSQVRIESTGTRIVDDGYGPDEQIYSATGYTPQYSVTDGIAAIAGAWERDR